ncbi:hypothetical protein [Paenibacillus amylolyticus]|uniref:hypothetical protein n=1 Tax=Paenibacillus amylolyticus TaxID=1451 RepID=UPI0033983297
MASEKTKGIKMTEDALKTVNERIAASGLDAYEWLESLMIREDVHNMLEKDPAAEHDLKDFHKHMNVIYHILIRMYQRGADTVDDIKEQTEKEKVLMEGKLEELTKQLSLTQKKLHEKEEELALVQESNDLLSTNLEQVTRSLRMLEELNNFTTVENQNLKRTIEKQENAVTVAEGLKLEINEMNSRHEEEMNNKILLLNSVSSELEQTNRKYENLELLSKENAARKEAEHKRDMELLRKEVEAEAKEYLLEEKLSWQEKMNQVINELNTQNTNNVSKLLQEITPKEKIPEQQDSIVTRTDS